MRTTFLVGNERRPGDAPLLLLAPGSVTVEASLLDLARERVPGASEHHVESHAHGPEAEAELLDVWTSMDADERCRVRAVVSPLAGVLARVPDLPSLGEALLCPEASPTHPNAQSRLLLTASVPDSWTLALEAGSPVDADAWRHRLLASFGWWRIRMVEPAQLARPGLGRGWLDDELFGPGGWLARQNPAREDRHGSRPVEPVSPSLEARVVRGRRGRLFLTKDSHDSHTQITGGRPLSDNELDQWAAGTASRLKDLTALGTQYLQLIGPAPQAVHPEDLPEGVTIAPHRPVRQILQRLERLPDRPDVLYPLAAFEHVRAFRDPFSKTDSHWNDLGTFLAYEAVLDRLHRDIPVRRLGRQQVAFHETCYVGDLGSKLRPERASTFLRARIDTPRARLVEDNRVRNHGRYAAYACDAAPPITCVVFGDSWAYSLLLFLAESFGRVVFLHRVNVVDREQVLRERPRVVLSVLTERFCTALPDDTHTVPFEQVEAKKIAAQDLVPTPSSHTRHEFLFSIALDRGLPLSGGVRLPESL